VRVSIVDGTADHVALRFDVVDTGIGITPEQMQRIFEPFCQGDGSTTRKYGGTGLGLSITRRIVELMHGQISVRSEQNRGSTFSFTCRFTGAHAAQAATDQSLTGAALYMLEVSGTNATIIARHARTWGMDVSSGAVFPTIREGTRTIVLVDDRWQGSIPELVERAKSVRDAVVRVYLFTSFGRRGVAADAVGDVVAGIVTRPVRVRRLRGAWLKDLQRTAPAGTVDRYNAAPRILIAEDNAVNQTVAARMVEKLGYRADVVASGAEAIQAAATGTYDVVLMDCQMPEIDGFAATSEIRQQENGRQHLPIIAMTAHAAPGDRERCMDVGMDDYISKPISTEELATVLSRWLADPVVRPGASLQPRTAGRRHRL
jgi:CheY-like chemotaxis protein